MKEKKICLLDMDGVVVRTHYYLEKCLQKKYPKFSMENVHTYNYNKELGESEIAKLGVPIDVIFKEFRNPEIFLNAEMSPHFISFLDSHAEEYDYIIHSLAYCKEVGEVKKIWLTEKLKDRLHLFKDIIIEVGNNKPALPNVDVVFEDSLKQLKKYQTEYPKTQLVLCNMPYNQEEYNTEYKDVFEKCKRIYSFEHVNL